MIEQRPAPPPARPYVGASPLHVGVAVCLAALALRIAGLWRTPWLDEAWTLQWVHAGSWRSWAIAVLGDQAPPVYPILLTAWATAGSSVAWLRCFSVLAGTGVVWLGARWAGNDSPGAAARAALLLACSPFLLRYSVELRAYPLLALLAAWILLESTHVATGPEGSRRRQAGLVAAWVVAGLTHFTAILLVPASFVAIWIASPDRRRARLPWTGAALAVALWAVAVAVQGRAFTLVSSAWWMPPLTPSLAWTSFAEVLGVASPGLPLTAGRSATLAVVIAALVALFVLARPDRRWLAPLGAALAYWAGLAATSLLWHPIWWPRTMLPAVVPLAVATAVAIGHLKPGARRAATALVAATAILGGGRWLMGEGRTPIEPWDVVARDMASERAPVATLVMPDYASPPLESALPTGHTHVVRTLRLDGRGNDDTIDGTITAGTGPIWLVVRVDLSLADRLQTVRPVVFRLARDAGAGPRVSRIVLLDAPDLALVPSGDATRKAVEAIVAEAFGASADRHAERGLTTYAVTAR